MSDGSGTAPTSRGTASRRRERRERQRAKNELDASGRSSVNGGSLDATRSSRRAEDVSDILTYDPMNGGVGDRARRGVTTRTAVNATGMDVNAPAASPGGKFDATSLLALLGDAVDAPRKDASEERRAVAKVEEMTRRRTMANVDEEDVRVERRETRVAASAGGNSSGAPTTSRERREKRRAERNATEQQTAMTADVNKKSTGAVGTALKTATTSSSLKVPEYSFVMLKDEDGRAPRKSVTFDANEESTVIGDSDSPAVKTSKPAGTGGGVWSQAAETMSFGASRGGGVKPTAVQLADALDDSVIRDSSKENSVADGEVSPQKNADNVILALPSTRRRFKEVSNAALGATRLTRTRKDGAAPQADDIQAEDSEILALPSTRRRMKEAGIAAGFLGALRGRKTASSGRVEPERSTATMRTERSTGSRDTHDSLRLQYQQGDHDEIDDLLQHRRGHLLKKLARLLNVYLDKLTGFKVVPTYPLDERISRFVIGKGIEI